MSLRLPGQVPRVPEHVDTWLRRVTFTLLGLLAFVLLTHQVFNSDVWWHLKTGQSILAGQGIPRLDPYTYTAAGREWIDMHWGFQVLIALAYGLAGPIGLNLYLYVVAGAALLVTALHQYDRRYWSITATFLLILLLTVNTRFVVRPELLTFLFLSLLVWLLPLLRDPQRSKWVWAVPVLIVVWANVQGLFMLGVVLVGFMAAGEVIRRALPMPVAWAGPEPLLPTEAGRLARVTLLSLGAGFMTPYGLRGLLFPFTLFTRVGGEQNVFSQVIAEFQPVFGAGPLTAPAETFLLFLVLGGAILIVNARYLALEALLAVVAFMFLALSARRNVPVAMFVLTPLVVGCACAALHRAERTTLWDLVGVRTWAQAGLGIFVCLIVVWHVPRVLSDRYYVDDRRGERFGLGVADNTYPGAAVDYILAHDLPAPLFNSMYIGGYAIYRLAPESYLVSLDSRLEVHTEDTISLYVAAARGPVELQGLLNMLRARTALITHSSQDIGNMFTSFLQLPDWHLVHLDACGAVFVRTAVLRERGIRPVSLPLPPSALRPASAELEEETPGWARALARAVSRLRIGSPFPAEVFNIGTLYLQLGRWDEAIPLLEAGVEQYPSAAYGWYNLGLAHQEAGQFDEAEAAYRRAVAVRPKLSSAWGNLGFIASARGDQVAARRAYERAIHADAHNITARYSLAATLTQMGEYARAYPHFSRLARQQPGNAYWWYQFGRACRRIGRFREGVAALDRAVGLDPTRLRYWLELSDLLFADAQPDRGTAALRAAFDLDPGSPEVRRRVQALGRQSAP